VDEGLFNGQSFIGIKALQVLISKNELQTATILLEQGPREHVDKFLDRSKKFRIFIAVDNKPVNGLVRIEHIHPL
jgi:hypothetical protein